MRGRPFWTIPCTRTVSPSAHPRPASNGATDFFLASALSFHQQALRPPGGEDTRCVEPMSATQTTCVHPHLACSRLALAAFAAGTPHGVLGSARYDRGTGWFTPSDDRFGGSSSNAKPRAPGLATVKSRAWAFSSHGADAIEPLTPLSQARRFIFAPLPPSQELQAGRTSFFWLVRTGRMVRSPPRPPLTPPREGRRLVMIRSAFHR
jgi:hypothetical protein